MAKKVKIKESKLQKLKRAKGMLEATMLQRQALLIQRGNKIATKFGMKKTNEMLDQFREGISDGVIELNQGEIAMLEDAALHINDKSLTRKEANEVFVLFKKRFPQDADRIRKQILEENG